MTTPEFQRYLEQPRLLYDLPLTDLQRLAMEYPYSPNLRLLLLLKARFDGHPEEEAYLNRAAAAAFDRAHVYDLLRDARVDAAPAEQEEMLELKSLDDLALEEAALPATPPTTTQAADLRYEDIFADILPPEKSEEEEDEDQFLAVRADDFSTMPPATETPEVPPTTVPDPEEWSATASAFLEATPHWPAAAEEPPALVKESAAYEPEQAGAPPQDDHSATEVASAPRPEPISRFAASVGTAAPAPLRERLRSIRRQQTEKLADEQEGVRRIARRSLVAQEAVASETLAQLLIRQGQYQNAIKMYRRLELLYPEKKTIFAGLIKDLKEKL